MSVIVPISDSRLLMVTKLGSDNTSILQLVIKSFMMQLAVNVEVRKLDIQWQWCTWSTFCAFVSHGLS